MPAELMRNGAEKAAVIQAGAEAVKAGLPTSSPPVQMQ
jgi:hypothetical protein